MSVATAIWAHTRRAEILAKVGRHDDALAALDDAIGLHRESGAPGSELSEAARHGIAELLNRRGAVLEALGKTDEALEAYANAAHVAAPSK